MAINVYLNFNGNCREAVEFYAQAFGTDKPHILTFGDAPQNPNHPTPEAAKNLVMHAQLTIKGSTVMFSDCFPGMKYVQGNNFSLTVVSQNMDEIKTFFNNLKEGSTVAMELQETFFSKCFGQLTDKFGINWQLSYDNGETGM